MSLGDLGQLIAGHKRRIKLFGEIKGLADMIAMTMGHQDPFDVFERDALRCFGVGDPRVNQNNFPPSRRILKRGVTEPPQFRLHRVRRSSDGKCDECRKKKLFHMDLRLEICAFLF